MNYLNCADKELSLLFVDDEEMRKINRHYFDRDYFTNVIAFSMSEGEYGHINPGILGDIVISVQAAMHDAQDSGISLNDEIDFLLIHGILHLLGYNHENTGEDERQRMKKREKEIFYHIKGYEIE